MMMNEEVSPLSFMKGGKWGAKTPKGQACTKKYPQIPLWGSDWETKRKHAIATHAFAIG